MTRDFSRAVQTPVASNVWHFSSGGTFVTHVCHILELQEVGAAPVMLRFPRQPLQRHPVAIVEGKFIGTELQKATSRRHLNGHWRLWVSSTQKFVQLHFFEDLLHDGARALIGKQF